MQYILALLTLFVLNALLCCTPAAPARAQPEQLGGRCMGLPPMCGIGLRPVCICYDTFGNNCQWQCVR